MYDKNDFIVREYFCNKNNKKKNQRWVMHYCDVCHKKRGYLPRNRSGKCVSCACKGRKISQEQRLKISKSLQGNTNCKNRSRESYIKGSKLAKEKLKKRSPEEKQKIAIKAMSRKLNLSEEEYLNTKDERALRRKISHNVRSMIYYTLKRNVGQLRHVDWSISDLKTHLESKFQPGMSWNNYGRYGWHIDHVIPICACDNNGNYIFKNLKNPNSDDFKKCWSLDNLQPLWAKDNLKKSNKNIS